MNKYESVIIIKPNKDKDEINKTIDKFKKIIEEFSNKEVAIDEIGEKRLAYEIQNNKTGYYTIFKFYSKPENIAELERKYRIDENIMKFIVVLEEKLEDYETEDDEEVQ